MTRTTDTTNRIRSPLSEPSRSETADSAASGGHTRNHAAFFLLVGIKGPIKDVINQLFFGLFDLIVGLLSDILREFIYLNPQHLRAVEGVYELGIFFFFVIVALYGTAMLGLFELFPSTERTDPIRFAARALAATTSIWIVNPPGWGPNLLDRGAFAAAFVVANELSDLYLDELGTGISFQSDQIANALGAPFVILGAGYLIGGTILTAELVLLILLLMRQVIVIATYALYPALIALWIADSGPMKYGQKLSSKMFQTCITLIAGGVIISAVFAVGMGLLTETSPFFAGGVPSSTTTDGAPVANGVFATPNPGDVVMNFLLKALIVIVVLGLPSLMLVQMLGSVGSALSSVAQAGAAVATSGASLSASVASQGAKTAAKQVGKQGLRKGLQSTAQMGASKAKAGAKKKVKQTTSRLKNTATDLEPAPVAANTNRHAPAAEDEDEEERRR
ncbi:hypothetical protein C440_06617 [Haloferax mucosum ATCC BAA-1512]|uniref:TrbL/VirB6 plasmid conjugal transfer protein n=1 Tax=Haloferax mucosum ATCC BAA-1512 TaxID=662479 RepID=M0IIS8_9EURY|nr:hypothetical protein [Haloferax mucosum]ELZ95942.1 hypothetical protein C440_06617 [Haloferax mucosum ATCC BAA-1512]